MVKEIGEIWRFVYGVTRVAWALWSGLVVTALLGFIKWKWKRDLAIAWFVAAVAATLTVASFVTWRDVYRKAESQEQAISGLETEKAGLVGAVSMYQSEIARLGGDIERLNLRLEVAQSALPDNLHVTVSGPKEPEPKITFSPRVVDSPRNEGYPPYAVRLTIESDMEVIAPDIEVKCTSPIAGMDFGEGADGINSEDPEGKATWRFTIMPKLTRAEPWTIVLFGKEPIDIISAKRVQ